MEDYKYLFGPVPSRRFGRSLGVDLTPYKTCSLDCVFCQLGRTTKKTITRQEYVPTDMVLSELEEWLKKDGRADYITLSGSGEPTLHSRFGEVLEFIRKNSAIPAVLLTNGTTLHLPEVRDAAACANVVKVSLSAWDQASYVWMNRPHPELRFDQLIEGQKAFRAQFKGQLWMEVFLVGGINSMHDDVQKIATLAQEIGPDRIHLNTAVRPPAEDFATALSKERMESLIHLFHPTAEIIAEFSAKHADNIQASQETIFSMLQRRPCTADQIAEIFGMHLNEVSKYLGSLIRTDQIRTERKNSTVYYVAKNMEDKG
jgi:wyosine [tRNA(Phe)-imidazoG37] synthetase (radical SAM superfamily)